MLELKKERGTLSAFCSECGSKLEKTTLELQELACSGEFREVDVLCNKCSSKLKVNIQLGVKEYGA